VGGVRLHKAFRRILLPAGGLPPATAIIRFTIKNLEKSMKETGEKKEEKVGEKGGGEREVPTQPTRHAFTGGF